MSLTKTGIEYLTHSWNFYTGCKHDKTVCPVADKCWARGMSNRFGRSFEPTLHPEKLLDPLSLRKPSRIGVCFTGDLFGDWVDPNQKLDVLKDHWHYDFAIDSRVYQNTIQTSVEFILEECPQHQFFFLTKAPQNYQKWGSFPDNAWVGATVCNDKMLDAAVDKLEDVQAKHKWISFEPLMEHITLSLDYALYYGGISWVVIGGWSGGKTSPKISWIKEIIEACDKVGVKVWLKDNLGWLKTSCEGSTPYYNNDESGTWILRQELP